MRRLFCFALFVFTSHVSGQSYKYYCVGNCNQNAEVPTEHGLMVMGGGTDVDAGFEFMINRSRGGDFLVLRTDDDDLYNPYIWALADGGLNSVATLVLLNASASFEAEPVRYLQECEALFIAGGDQWQYYSWWKGTPIQQVIEAKIANGSYPIGGTSAGSMSLSQFVSNAEFDTVESKEALADPYNVEVTLGENFFSVPQLAGLVVDTHFVQRDRMGRLVTFAARLLADVYTPVPVRAIGVDEETVLLIDSAGIVSVRSWLVNGSAYFLESSFKPDVCQPKKKLAFGPIDVVRVTGNATSVFDIGHWAGLQNFTSYTLAAKNGVLQSSNGHIY
eukprot:TRINITY_DN8498_c0_g1_i1.p1 TRINITY_DN8498_c0_g1~~TRINITY_DN8498_c0_g1_i1.p1  ORF type:complete len:362 (+),score=83.12 TRINITY_DN8498_c0_g1_i1:88-1086(+)